MQSNHKVSDDLLLCLEGGVDTTRCCEWAATATASIFRVPVRVVSLERKQDTLVLVHSCGQRAPGSRLANSLMQGLVVVAERASGEPSLCADTFARTAPVFGDKQVGVSAVTPGFASEVWSRCARMTGHRVHACTAEGVYSEEDDNSCSFGWGAEHTLALQR